MQFFVIIVFTLLIIYSGYIQVKINKVASKYRGKYGWGVLMRDLNEDDKSVVKKYIRQRFVAFGIVVILFVISFFTIGILRSK
jgi:hypothetical protein